ncbi:hypothetical protein [Dyella sp.]|uniref:DUF6429 family protein n=1 Tax=Dyella sp. TaxID=1869338 RepID=UPI002FDA4BB6
MKMQLNTDAIDDATLALLYLTLHDNERAWKGHDWDAINRCISAASSAIQWAKRNRWPLPRKA